MLLFQSAKKEDTATSTHPVLGITFLMLTHVPVLPTGNDFTCRERFDDLVAKRCPSCTLSMKRAMF